MSIFGMSCVGGWTSAAVWYQTEKRWKIRKRRNADNEVEEKRKLSSEVRVRVRGMGEAMGRGIGVLLGVRGKRTLESLRGMDRRLREPYWSRSAIRSSLGARNFPVTSVRQGAVDID